MGSCSLRPPPPPPSLVTTLSLHNQISTPSIHNYLTATPKITFTFENFFLLLYIKFYEKQVSLINKLQPLSYQYTSNITPCLPLHTPQPTRKLYNATALLTHPQYTFKKISRTRSVTSPKFTLPQRLVSFQELRLRWVRTIIAFFMKDINYRG